MTRTMGATKMGDILEALREVRENLDRRAHRAYGALLMVWGAVGAVIFAFYQLVTWNPAPYDAALGPWLRWAWVLPLSVGYAASAVVGARLGRLGRRSEAHSLMLVGAGVTVGVVLLLLLIVSRQYDRIPGMWLVMLSATILVRVWAERQPGPIRAASLATAAVAAGAGLWVLVAPFPLANAVAAAIFLVGCGTLGTLRYLGVR